MDDSIPESEDSVSLSLVEPMTVVTETPVAISYSVQGESTIPSDEKDHQVSIAVLPFEAQISYVTVPRIEPCIYLQVGFRPFLSSGGAVLRLSNRIYSVKSRIRASIVSYVDLSALLWMIATSPKPP